MGRLRKPGTIARAARDRLAAAGVEAELADRAIARMLLDRVARERGIGAPDWPGLLAPGHQAVADEASEVLSQIDMAGWEIADVGSVYEHLLGREGAWFTPQSLVDVTLEFSVAPQMEELCAEHDPGSVLRLVVIDPSCGCGAFLIAAARMIAVRYAERLLGEATDLDVAIVMPQVLSETIFGVDIDEAAVDVCKFGLWLEVGGVLPIGFMDRNVVCNDTLSGPEAEPPKFTERMGASGHGRLVEVDAR